MILNISKIINAHLVTVCIFLDGNQLFGADFLKRKTKIRAETTRLT